MKAAIQTVIRTMMDRVMDRVLITDPFCPDEHHAKKPLYAALVPDEIFKGAHFERRFVTPFGSVWERLAQVAAEQGLGRAEMGYLITGSVAKERLRRISEVLNSLEHSEIGRPRQKPDWERELAYVLAGDGDPIPVPVMCDLFAENLSTGDTYTFELKAPLPNSDQTKVSKEKILKLYAMTPCPVTGAYFALPYNPYGTRDKYNWPFPARWFDMQHDPVVLIGGEFWDKLGGPGTYLAFIEAVNELGPAYRDRIYREFLGIEPPASAGPIPL
jgi:hypothetical protein